MKDKALKKEASYDASRGLLTVKGVRYQMVAVQGGTFMMGTNMVPKVSKNWLGLKKTETELDPEADPSEMPRHEVTLSNYSIGQTEVTQALWRAVMGSDPSWFKGDNLPVEWVSWDDCQKFIGKLNALTGQRFRLPTEAEWEYAARGGARSKGYKYAGSNYLDSVAWYESNSDDETHPVGTKSPNELGLYDMSGNVREWCQDRYGDYSSSPQTNPAGSSTGSDRVYRGGCWLRSGRSCRVSDRGFDTPAYRYVNLGFRLALDEEENLEQRPVDPVTSPLKEASYDAYSGLLTVKDVRYQMVLVESGTFTMGATSKQGSDAYCDEKPVHRVTLSDFSIGQTLVTQALWRAVMGNNPSRFKGDNLPVEQVSWDDCQEFIRRLNVLTGQRFRLPTEAEWEYAARGGVRSQGYKYAGSNNLDNVAWYSENSGKYTHPVGTKSPNELGLYDMSGNVWEWCQDWYDDYNSSPQTDPTGPSTGSRRVGRGGSWYFGASDCRVWDRYGNTSTNCSYDLGLRLALDEKENPEQWPVDSMTLPLKEASYDVSSAVLVAGDVRYQMVSVEGGTFMMGANMVPKFSKNWLGFKKKETELDPEADPSEMPRHEVTLSNYSIGQTEVTQALWCAVMGSNPSYFKGDNLPVECVSWDDCQEFIRRLNALTGQRFRLPTEAEWEYAARGGARSQGYKYAGGNNLGSVAWYEGNSGYETHSVGTKSPNELGLYDMSGNVWEWCEDWYSSNYYSSSLSTNPAGPSTGSHRVCRGGSNARNCRVSHRSGSTPTGCDINLGFRLAL